MLWRLSWAHPPALSCTKEGHSKVVFTTRLGSGVEAELVVMKAAQMVVRRRGVAGEPGECTDLCEPARPQTAAWELGAAGARSGVGILSIVAGQCIF